MMVWLEQQTKIIIKLEQTTWTAEHDALPATLPGISSPTFSTVISCDGVDVMQIGWSC